MEPLAHGPFLIEADGALRAARPPSLRFTWRGRGVEARLEEGSVRLSAAAGAVPYTVERPAGRSAALAAVARLPEELPRGWRVRLSADHRLRLEAAMELPERMTATALIGAMVGFALALDPWLERLEAVGFGVSRWPPPPTVQRLRR